MSVRIETVHNPRVRATTVGELAEDSHYEHSEDEADDAILALNYDEVVVITGDLKTFARDVWSAVFDQDAPDPTHCDRHGGPRGSDETCQDCVDDEGRTRCGHNDQRLNEDRLIVCNDCGQTILPTTA